MKREEEYYSIKIENDVHNVLVLDSWLTEVVFADVKTSQYNLERYFICIQTKEHLSEKAE